MQDGQYIKGLINQDRKVLRAIYQNFAKRISQYVLQQGGSVEDAQDVFQDSLLALMENVQSPDFKLKSSFYTYLFSINKYVWYNKAEKKARKSVTIPEDDLLIDQTNIERYLLNVEKENVFEANFSKLGAFCKQLLTLFFEKKSMTEIAERLQLKNEHTARTRKYRCREKLKQLIQSDSKYQELESKK